YTNGDLGTQGGWANFGGSPDVQVANTTPLIYTGYTAGTQYATVSGVDGTDPRKSFSTPINTSGNKTILISFLVRVSSAPGAGQTPLPAITLENTANTNYPCRFFIRANDDATGIQFGIAAGSTDPVYTSGEYQYDVTYLILIRYDVVTGANNDDAYIWVNPALGAEPSTAIAINETGATQRNSGEVDYGTQLNAFRIWQSGIGSPAAAYDGFRVAAGDNSAAAWATLAPVGAPLPVQLTSFNASEEGLSTKLVWNTADESSITEYIVEKSTDGRTYTAIGTVKAVNLRSYNFTDAASAENSYYRLKMVDVSGTYKYSYIVSIKAKLNTSISLSPNPVKNSLMIQHPKATISSHVQVISAAGQLLRDFRLSVNAVISNVDMSGLPSGLYHIVYKNGSELFSKTVLKQ
ncbi:MAG TPA: T9SS type A sorting domain-containing protein, partial [Niastella sp.]|nr:T9SS type A sorting domain-containing protein [Niastella sp.]